MGPGGPSTPEPLVPGTLSIAICSLYDFNISLEYSSL